MSKSTEELEREAYINVLQISIPLEDLKKKATIELARLYYLNILSGGSGATEFKQLIDTPADYLGQGGKTLKVKLTEDGIEFAEDIEKAYFFVSNKLPSGSGGSITVNNDPNNPTFLSGMTVDKIKGMSLTNQAEGIIRNDTGRTIELMTGTINFNPIIASGTASLIIISERSSDGVAWTGNLESKRQVEISNNTETFATKLSVVTNWLPGELVRFRVYLVTGNLTLEPNSSVALGGQTFFSPSVAWSLVEA